MFQLVVFFLIFLSFGLEKRLLQKNEGRRELGYFGRHVSHRHESRHHRRGHETYDDNFFGRGQDYREDRRSRHQRRRHSSRQSAVGADDKDIDVDKLEGHFPFDKKDGDNWENILEKSKSDADAMAAKAKEADDAEMKADNGEEDAEKKKEDEEEENKKKEKEKEDEAPPDSPGQEGVKEEPKFLVKMGSAAAGRNGLAQQNNYVPDTVPQKKACEFTPSNCYCGARPTQQMDLLCASKKREYCGWFCKHKMGGREGKPKTGSDQFAGGEQPQKLNPAMAASPEGCPKPTLQSCESIYSDPASPDYVGAGYAPPGANCVCHIDEKTGHAVITDLPNHSVPADGAAGAAPAAAAPAAAGDQAPTSNGAGPDSGAAATPAQGAVDGVAGAVNAEVDAAANTANQAGAAAANLANEGEQAAETAEKESKGLWDHAKGMAGAVAGKIGNLGGSLFSGAKGIGKAIFGEETGVQSANNQDEDLELYLAGGEHPERAETSLSNSLGDVLEEDVDLDHEVAIGAFGVH